MSLSLTGIIAVLSQKSAFYFKTGSFYHLTRINSYNQAQMKKIVGFLLIVSFVFSGCAGGKSYYKTREGKKKQKYYNDIQFGGRKARQGY